MDGVHEVSAALLELTESLRVDQPRDETLGRLAARVVSLMPGADAASVTLFDHDTPITVAATDDAIIKLDTTQYSLSDGPCLEATRRQAVVRTGVEDARRRWPEFAAVADEAEVVAMLSCPLFVQANDAAHGHAADEYGLSGALNVWSRQHDAFDPLHAALIAMFTTAMAGVILTASRWITAQNQAQQLSVALESRDTISTAKGIVMARRHLTIDEAFGWLTEVSQRTNRKLRDIAAVIVADPGTVHSTQ